MKLTLFLSKEFFEYERTYDFCALLNMILQQLEDKQIPPQLVEKKYTPRSSDKFIPLEIRSIKARFRCWQNISQVAVLLEDLLKQMLPPDQLLQNLEQGFNEAFPYGMNVFMAEHGCVVGTGDYEVHPEDVPRIKKAIDEARSNGKIK